MKLTDFELRACQILLAAARAGIRSDEMKREMRLESIPELIWRSLYDEPLDTVSGTTGLTGAADSVLVLNRDSQGLTLYGRGRDIDEIETAMSFERTTGRWSILGNALEVRRSDERSATVCALLAAAEPLGLAEIAAATGMKDQNVRFLLQKMAVAGEIGKEGRGRYVPSNNANTLTINRLVSGVSDDSGGSR
jgi:hypothetical protein